MKIAQIAPLYESIPPQLYGGTERVVAHLTDTLVELGHDVTLFASAEAHTKAQLVVVRDQAIRLDAAPLKSDLAAHLAMLHEVKRRSWQFDVLHFHTDMLHFTMFEALAHKTVTTVHGRLDMKDLAQVYACWPSFGLVSISNDQRRPLARCNWMATVPHGFPSQLYSFTERPQDDRYLAFLGRVSPEKGLATAIAFAKRVGMRLKIAAKVDACDAAYFETVLRPTMDHPLIEFMGEIGDARKSEFLGNAVALLFPINWPEPFGLVMIEAMACGTPVIAWNCGAVAEVVADGVSGFIVSSVEQAVKAFARLAELDRRQVRAHFERRFTASAMANAYVQIYERLTSAQAFKEPRGTKIEATYELDR
jgi:glycosyltransferase involved in cell wall biosynthesis